MIIDYLDNAARYTPLHTRFAAGFEFLRRPDLGRLDDGRHDITGDALFAIVARDQGKGRERAMLEIHRRYLDIQYIVSGEDVIGWLPLADCSRESTPFDAEKDLGFFYDRPKTWVTVPSGAFAVFHPEDAHAPLATEGAVHKVIVKVLIDG